jgi:hypothetical protein
MGTFNLFLNARKLTERKEDLLTEFFAAALHVSATVRRRYYKLVLDDYCRGRGWANCEIRTVDTQCVFRGTSCQPDMVLSDERSARKSGPARRRR